MLKTISKFEITIESRVFQFFCEIDSPIEHAKEALFQFQKMVGQIEDNAKQMQQKQQEEAKEKSECSSCSSVVEELKPAE